MTRDLLTTTQVREATKKQVASALAILLAKSHVDAIKAGLTLCELDAIQTVRDLAQEAIDQIGDAGGSKTDGKKRQTYEVTRNWWVTDTIEVRAVDEDEAMEIADNIERFPMAEHEINKIEVVDVKQKAEEVRHGKV